MTLGQKLKELRSLKGLTQKELADKLHVSFQTVSKWENGENEPDIATLKELAVLFNCSVDYLIGSENEGLTPAPAAGQTIIIHQKELHVCRHCNKDIPEDELVVRQLSKTQRFGRSSRRVSLGEAYYHKACLEEVERQAAEEEAKKKAVRARRAKKLSFGWGIAGGIVALGACLGIFLGAVPTMPIYLSIILSVVIGYSVFAGIYCIIAGSYIADLFAAVSGWSIHFPGLIFTWNLEGFAWLIGMKILFAILGFLFGIFVIALAVFLSAALGAISFPFVLIHNIHTNYQDTLIN